MVYAVLSSSAAAHSPQILPTLQLAEELVAAADAVAMCWWHSVQQRVALETLPAVLMAGWVVHCHLSGCWSSRSRPAPAWACVVSYGGAW